MYCTILSYILFYIDNSKSNKKLGSISILSVVSFVTVAIVLILCVTEMAENPSETSHSKLINIGTFWEAVGATNTLILHSQVIRYIWKSYMR
eukprot:UN02679